MEDPVKSPDLGEDIDGRKIAQQVKNEIKDEVERLVPINGRPPKLVVVIIGDRPESQAYVRMKKRAAVQVGIESIDVELPESVTESGVLSLIESFNKDDTVDGLIVQSPFPSHISPEKVVRAIAVSKDVDGFHPENIGLLALKGMNPKFVSCTPMGVMELLARSGVQLKGKKAIVVGRSNIVGIPMALLLTHADCTVTICHSRTQNIADVVRQGDIVIAAVGVPEMVKSDWLKPGCVVIDVGITRVDDESKKSGYRLAGDVVYKDCKLVASQITPVPGGVGPMTVAILLRNTLIGYKRRFRNIQD